MNLKTQVTRDIKTITKEWQASGCLKPGDVIVIGCSTSEVVGEKIGTAGSEAVASALFEELTAIQTATGVQIAFQCCEHLNRSLVVEKETMQKQNLTEVSAVPVPRAGGSMASFAYKNMKNPVLVESIEADGGLDIGETMIGMHLKPVAVPLRFSQRSIGGARATAARTRPKLIGGERAVYDQETAENMTGE
ncbi:TIGR01440 family protein [Lentibacillus persicus]|uniref:UPF0340 protein SAMN05216238_10875 n=1 Tax=Lentibacillus persicus TaxID=640948 RepID=A0A1I1XVN2_9BACI|nr:TIGR01440 family protein [Lentibacillus persicus]SFE09610.1 TIGR01440 family protein [Lentibacillus persicus]